MLCIVNRNRDQAIKTDIISQTGEFSGAVKVYEVNGPDIKSVNDFGVENVKTVAKPDINPKGNTVTYSFPPHSLTMLKGNLK